MSLKIGINGFGRIGRLVVRIGAGDPDLEFVEDMPLTSGYLQRAREILPKQSTQAPWKRCENYLIDLLNLRYHRIRNKGLRFSS